MMLTELGTGDEREKMRIRGEREIQRMKISQGGNVRIKRDR